MRYICSRYCHNLFFFMANVMFNTSTSILKSKSLAWLLITFMVNTFRLKLCAQLSPHYKPVWKITLSGFLKGKLHGSYFVFVYTPSVSRRHQWRRNGNFCLESGFEPLLAPSLLCVFHVSGAAGRSDLFLSKWKDPLRETPCRASKTTMLFLWWGKMDEE